MVTGELPQGVGEPLFYEIHIIIKKGPDLSTSSMIVLRYQMLHHTSSASVTLPIDKWAKIHEIAQKYKCRSQSQAISICIQKFIIEG